MLRSVCSAAVEYPGCAGATVRVAAAIIANVVGAAVVTSDAHGLRSDVTALGGGAEAQVETCAGPTSVGDSRSGSRLAKRWKSIAGDNTVALAGVDGLANAVGLAPAVFGADFRVALRAVDVHSNGAVIGNAEAIADGWNAVAVIG